MAPVVATVSVVKAGQGAEAHPDPEQGQVKPKAPAEDLLQPVSFVQLFRWVLALKGSIKAQLGSGGDTMAEQPLAGAVIATRSG